MGLITILGEESEDLLLLRPLRPCRLFRRLRDLSLEEASLSEPESSPLGELGSDGEGDLSFLDR